LTELLLFITVFVGLIVLFTTPVIGLILGSYFGYICSPCSLNSLNIFISLYWSEISLRQSTLSSKSKRASLRRFSNYYYLMNSSFFLNCVTIPSSYASGSSYFWASLSIFRASKGFKSIDSSKHYCLSLEWTKLKLLSFLGISNILRISSWLSSTIFVF
jgi:hypothetical protein